MTAHELNALQPSAAEAVDDLMRFVKDANGIDADMLDHAVAIFAEGFATGETNIRNLLYCVIRDALKQERLCVPSSRF